MFKLPVCPHCGTVYRYKDVKDAVKKKENVCYHCKKSFTAKVFPYILAEILITAAAAVGINIFILFRMKDFSFVPLFAVTIIAVIIMWLLVPLFVKFKKR